MLEHQVSYSAGFCKQSATKRLYVMLAVTCLSHEANGLVVHCDCYRLTGINNKATRLQPPPNKPVWESNWTRTTLHTSRGTNLQQECSKTNSPQVLEADSEGETVLRPVLDVFLDVSGTNFTDASTLSE